MWGDRGNLHNTSKGTKIGNDLSKAQPGDILYWTYPSGSGRSGHVAIYSGNNKMIHCLNTKYNTVETSTNKVWVHNEATLDNIVRINGISNNRISVTDGTYVIQNEGGLYLDIEGEHQHNGARLMACIYNGNKNQQFRIKNLGNNYFTITAVHSGKVIESPMSLNDGAEIIQHDYEGGADWKTWYAVDAGNGYVLLINKYSGKAMDMVGGVSINGTLIAQYGAHYGFNQKFKFIKK